LTQQVLMALLAVVAGVGASLLYFFGTNFVLDRVAADGRRPDGSYLSREPLRNAIRPWLFVLPALVILGVYLVYPVIETTRLSLFDRTGTRFVGIANYRWAVGQPRVPVGHPQQPDVAAGRAGPQHGVRPAGGDAGRPRPLGQRRQVADLHADGDLVRRRLRDLEVRVRLPRPGVEQIGIVNAIVVALGGAPQAWITVPFWNNFFLMLILVWIQTGFAMVILSAALRGVPEETIEAAKIDGASEFAVFFQIIVPQIMSTILVVWTTITIVVLKVFDIVLAMTNGQWGTEVLANSMYNWMFRGGGDFGRGSVIALVIMIAVVPIMVWNIRRFQTEEAMR
jgi:alpha-glucoside transport system permease protein